MKSLFENLKAIAQPSKKSTSISLCASLLTISASVGIGVTLNPERSLAGACAGVYSSRSGVPTAAQSQIGYYNSISKSYVNIATYNDGGNINAIATQPLTGNLFFVNRATGKTVVYNVNTGSQTTLTGTLPGTTTNIIGATFNATGNLYVYYGANKTLIEVDPATGNQIGSTINISGIPGNNDSSSRGTNGDIAIGTDGILYAIGDTSSNAGSYTSQLFSITISGTTAVATPVNGSNLITGVSGAAVNGLAIDPSTNKFYISTNNGTYELDFATKVGTQLTSAIGTNDLAACGSPKPDLPTIAKAFSPDTVTVIPATSTLTLTLGNTNSVPIYLIQALTDNFQSGLKVSTPNGLSGTCTAIAGNTVTAAAGSSSISLNDGFKIPAGGCTVSVNVTAGTVGTYVNNIAVGALKTFVGDNANAASSTLTVTTTSTISGTLYEDSDGGDDLDATEPKLPANITVKLLDSSNNVILTTTTDANGAYTFTGVTNGNYKIQVDTSDTDIPAGYTLGTPNDLAVTVSGSAVTNQNFGFDEPTTGNICVSPSIATLPSTFNSSNYTKNTALQGLVPLSFYDGSMQVSASLSGTATWNNGVQVQTGNLGSFTGDYLYLQPTNASNYLASNNEATYVLSFPSGVPNFSMIGGGLNNNDGTTIIASYKGVPIQITAANFSKLSSGMTLKDADGDGQSDTVVSSSTTGGTNVDTNTYKLTIPVPVDKITVVSGKDESGNNSTVTIGLHTFQYCYEGGAVSGTLYEDSDRGNDLDASEPKLPKDITVTLYKDNNSNNTIDAGEEVANTLTNDQGQYTFNNVAAGTYKVKVDTTDTDISSSYTLGTPNDLAVTVSGSAITGKDFGFDIPSNPNVLLVKRITKVNNSTTTKNGDNLAGYIDEATNLYDDNTLDNPVSPAKPDTNKWVDADNDTKPDLIGGINGGNVQPGDEIEYTIYYLSAGDTTANNVVICDRVPENATFIPTAFNNFATKNTTGLSGGDRGIVWQNNGATESLTNTSDGDTAEYLSPGIDPTIKYPGINCNGSNTNGAVIVKLGNVPNATAPGTPINSYGFIRFQGRVK
jgi:SdrD B-like domain